MSGSVDLLGEGEPTGLESDGVVVFFEEPAHLPDAVGIHGAAVNVDYPGEKRDSLIGVALHIVPDSAFFVGKLLANRRCGDQG
jgi:hypothetical protein